MNPKLIQRIKTALVLGIILIPMLLYSHISALILFTVILFLMLYEYFSLVFTGHSSAFTNVFSGIALSIAAAYGFYRYLHEPPALDYVILVNCILCLLNIVWLLWKKKALIGLGLFRFQAVYYLTIPLVVAMLFILEVPNFQWIILYVFILIWISDSGAYFFGSRFGHKKLFEAVSPNKTFAGIYGAGLMVAITAFVLSLIDHHFSFQNWMIIALLVWVFGTFGDLVESSLKRQFQVKDSADFLPGHGGFLDRFDSFIFVLPFILYYLTICT